MGYKEKDFGSFFCRTIERPLLANPIVGEVDIDDDVGLSVGTVMGSSSTEPRRKALKFGFLPTGGRPPTPQPPPPELPLITAFGWEIRISSTGKSKLSGIWKLSAFPEEGGGGGGGSVVVVGLPKWTDDDV